MDAVVKTLAERLKAGRRSCAARRPTRDEAGAAVRVPAGLCRRQSRIARVCSTRPAASPRPIAGIVRRLRRGRRRNPRPRVRGGRGLRRHGPRPRRPLLALRAPYGALHWARRISPIASDGVVGLSKLARLVDMYAKRLQTQETMTAQIVRRRSRRTLAARRRCLLSRAEHMHVHARRAKQGADHDPLHGNRSATSAEQVRFMKHGERVDPASVAPLPGAAWSAPSKRRKAHAVHALDEFTPETAARGPLFCRARRACGSAACASARTRASGSTPSCGDTDLIDIGGARAQLCRTVVRYTDPGFPLVGANATIGHNVILHGCIVGEGALIGMGATILNGAKIKNCLVGANALVTEGRSFPTIR